MARLGRNGFIALAVVFHFVYIFSIFDIYFVSPIVHGMTAFRADDVEAPAKRLVLFVGDGLRADKAFQSFPDPSPEKPGSPEALVPRPLAPFLRSRVLQHGTFGVSHTRVPTESRPGHVALIAGLYEDVSAVTTGWKLNPVDFDSVFNRSRHTWSWGSPDILPMFEQGAVPGRVYADTYPPEMEDFSQDAKFLDTWVFDRVKKLFKDAEKDRALDHQLRQDQNVFFLHLLGLDTTGHSYRPYSREYLDNIKVVDKGVEEITALVEHYFGDDKTAFVFTADHGMSDWGSHGDGHPDNTRTPLIAWGSGVAKPNVLRSGIHTGHADNFSFDWGLQHVQRHDVAQADVAALMAHLAGLEYPTNSVGELPISYLAADESVKAKALLANSKGILEQYRVKEEQKKQFEINFQPFAPLSEEHSAGARVAEVQQLVQQRRFAEAIRASEALTKLGLEGMRYLQIYDWLFLRTLVTVGYLGWIAFALSSVVEVHVLQGKVPPSRPLAGLVAFSAAGVALFAFLFVRKSPATYYAYAVFPVVLWEEVFARRHALSEGRKALLGQSASYGGYLGFALNAVLYVGLLEALVQSYAIRKVYTGCYLLAVAWPFFYGSAFVKENALLVATWAVSCISMSLFTLLPAIKVETISLVLLGGFLMFTVGLAYLLFEKSIVGESPKDKIGVAEPKAEWISRSILGVQVGLIGLAMVVTRASVASLTAKLGLPLGAQVVGWITLIASLAVPFLHAIQPNSHYLHRLAVLFLTFAPMFVILTISYEGLFYLAFSTVLFSWALLEHRVYVHTRREDPVVTAIDQTPRRDKAAAAAASLAATPAADPAASQPLIYRPLTLSDARVSLFFFYLLQSGFFSVGNIASISSFSLDAVYRLIPIFDPFSQGALLVLKILTPFALVSAVLGVLNLRLRVAPSALFMVVTAASEWLTIRFFWSVRDEGSWLEIGETITRFVLASLLGVFVALLELASGLFVGGVVLHDAEPVAVMPSGETAAGKTAAAAIASGAATGAQANGSAKRRPNGKAAAS